MPAPTEQTYSLAAKIAAHTAFRDLIDADASPGLFRIRNSADQLLAEVTLAYPCGTVNAGTGQLVFDLDPIPRDEAIAVGGTGAYGEFCDGAGVVHLAMPCQAGSAAVSGKVVLNTLTLVAGGPLELVAATVG